MMAKFQADPTSVTGPNDLLKLEVMRWKLDLNGMELLNIRWTVTYSEAGEKESGIPRDPPRA